MASVIADRAAARAAAPPVNGRRWLALAFIALAQLMVALDATIVNIALPTAQSSLQFSDAQRQWVITSYTLAFGGLLLLGGRVADAMGRKRALLFGLAGFAAASAVSGAAVNLPMLLAARALQGAFAAILAPTALSLLAVTFTEPRDRARAFAVYGGIAGSGGAAGLVLDGALTQYLDWRWCLYVNVPIAAVAAVGVWRLLADAHAPSRQRFDLLGVLFGSGGLIALVDACTEAVSQGWQAPSVIGLLVIGVASLALFVAWESRAATPLLPLRILFDRNRGGAYLCAALAIAGMFGAFLFLTYYLQVVLQYSPLQAGLAFLPLSAAAMLGSGAIASQLLPRVPPRALMVPGFLVAAAGMTLLMQLQVSSGYVTHILPAEILLGLGIGCVMVPASSLATGNVDPREAGIAAATLNVAQQVGASVGVALLNTLAATTTGVYLAAAPSATRADGLVHGYATAASWGAAILLGASLVALGLIDARVQPQRRGA
jgi:EmrB/QacA subfamily drug resistance transporter